MSEPTPDLAAIMNMKRINNAHRASEGIYTATAYDEFYRLIFADWPILFAALERTAELERALREYGRCLEGCPGRFGGQESSCSCGWRTIQAALLARSAEKEGSERG